MSNKKLHFLFINKAGAQITNHTETSLELTLPLLKSMVFEKFNIPETKQLLKYQRDGHIVIIEILKITIMNYFEI